MNNCLRMKLWFFIRSHKTIGSQFVGEGGQKGRVCRIFNVYLHRNRFIVGPFGRQRHSIPFK